MKTGSHSGGHKTGCWGAMNSASRPLKWAIDQARRELLDPSRRNRLLHAPLTGKRPWCMAVVGHDPDELFHALCRQENFRGYAFGPAEDRKEQADSSGTNRPQGRACAAQVYLAGSSPSDQWSTTCPDFVGRPRTLSPISCQSRSLTARLPLSATSACRSDFNCRLLRGRVSEE